MSVTASNNHGGIELLIRAAIQLPISQNEHIERVATRAISDAQKRKNTPDWIRRFSATLNNAYDPKELDFRVWMAVNGILSRNKDLLLYTKEEIAHQIASSTWKWKNDFELTEAEGDGRLIQETYYEEKQKYAGEIKDRLKDQGADIDESDIYDYMNMRDNAQIARSKKKPRKSHRHLK